MPTLEIITQRLIEKGYCVIPSLLFENQLNNIQERFRSFQKKDEFKKAGIGKNIDYQIDTEVRGNQIRWIDTTDIKSPIQPYFDFVFQLMQYLNQELYISLKDLESIYAFYPKGKGYLKHRDRFKKQPHRVISLVYYLNENWNSKDGGDLILYNDQQEEIFRLLPKSNVLVVFKSEMIHEVLPVQKERQSITTWLLDIEKDLSFIA